MPIDPLFGIELAANELTNNIPMAPLYVITPNNKFIPAKADEQGRLELGAVTLEIGDLQIGAVELKDHTTNDRVHITPDNEVRSEARLHDEGGIGITSTLVGIKQGIDVNVVGGTAISASTDEDDSVPASMTLAALINLTYGYDGVDWQRINSTAGSLHVNLTNASVPVTQSGIWNINNISGTISLPTGASTEATLSGFRTDFNAVDFATETTLAAIKAQTDLFNFTGSSLDVNITGGATLEINLDNANDDVLVYGNDGVTNRAIKTDAAGELQVDVLTLPSDIDIRDLNFSTDSVEVRQTTHDNLNLNANLQVANTDVSVGNPVPVSFSGTVDVSDRVAREIGRVSGSDTIHTSESYGTTDTDANARPTNGNFVVRYHKTKSIAIANTGANNARITVAGSVDGGTNFDIIISNNVQVNAANTLVINEERAMTHIRVLARAANAGNQTTIVTRGYSLGT